MKKQLIISGVTILLIVLGLSGCFEGNDTENNENSKANLFIGKWKTTIYYYDINGTRYDELPSNSTFYTNGTMGSESAYDDAKIWTPYIIQDSQICLGQTNETDYYCYNYEFSDDGTEATLQTYVQDPNSGEEYEIFIEMIKK